MENHNETVEQRLKGIEARVTVLEEQGVKLDRLIYKLFQRVPKSGQRPAEATADEAV